MYIRKGESRVVCYMSKSNGLRPEESGPWNQSDINYARKKWEDHMDVLLENHAVQKRGRCS